MRQLSRISATSGTPWAAAMLARSRAASRPGDGGGRRRRRARFATLLDDAVERGWLATNPARGRRRRLKAPRPHGTFLEPDELKSLLEAAGHVEQEAGSHQKVARREIVATLGLAGLRVTELCELTWKQLDLAHARIDVPDAKTPIGIRQVDMTRCSTRFSSGVGRTRRREHDPSHLREGPGARRDRRHVGQAVDEMVGGAIPAADDATTVPNPRSKSAADPVGFLAKLARDRDPARGTGRHSVLTTRKSQC